MAIRDVTLGITDQMPVWPGETAPRLTPVKRIEHGDPANVSAIQLGTHSGTHVDAPWHFVPDGDTIGQLDLETLVGPAWVSALEHVDRVTAADLEALPLPAGVERLIIRTRNSQLLGDPQFHRDFIGLSPDAAEWIVDRAIRLIGIDYISVEPFGTPGNATHKTLLSAGVVVVEGLDLQGIEPGWYQLLCLPLKLIGADGAPARAILIDLPEE